MPAKWISNKDFNKLEHVNIFHKEREEKEIMLDDHLKNYHAYFRKSFELEEKDLDYCQIKISADDYYKLYINGVLAAQGPSQSYPFNYSYNLIDVSGLLKSGKNVIVVHIYYHGLISRSFVSGDNRMGLYLELYNSNGIIISSDESFKTKRVAAYIQEAHIIGYSTQFAENIDSELLETDCFYSSYDDLDWENAEPIENDDHIFKEEPDVPVAIYDIHPEKIDKISKGRYLYDFSKELAGGIEICASANKKAEITIRFGEELEQSGDVRFVTRANCRYEEKWSFFGENITISNYDYKAFRYLEILFDEESIQIEGLKAIARNYPIHDNKKALFYSSNRTVTDIWEICERAVIIGAQEAYLDTPSREKGQYLGDLAITGKSHMYISGDSRMYKKAILDFADSSFVCEGLLAVSPSAFMQEIADYSLLFPDIVLHYYMFTGDLKLLRKVYPSIVGVISFFEKHEHSNGLLYDVASKWNMVDWPEGLRDEYDFPLTNPIGQGIHNVINAYYYGAVKAYNKIRDILKIKYVDKLPDMKKSFNEQFLCKETNLYKDSPETEHSSIHSNALPLLFEIAGETQTKAIVELIREKGLNCGVYMSYFVLKALAKANEHQLLWELIIGDGEHSWANMLREGATTCFEAWGLEQKWNTSLCHPWASAPIPVIIEDIFGIEILEPGFKKYRINPHYPQSVKNGLEEMSIRFHTSEEDIKSGALLLVRRE